jgi:hypothetical protein
MAHCPLQLLADESAGQVRLREISTAAELQAAAADASVHNIVMATDLSQDLGFARRRDEAARLPLVGVRQR